MASPFIEYDKLLALSSNAGYTNRPSLSQTSSVFLLSACLVMRQRWLWQNPITPITDTEYEDIIQLIETAEAELMTGNIGEIIASVADLSSNDAYLLLDGSTVAQADYPELTAVAPAGWLLGTDIVLPDMTSKGLFGNDGANLGDMVGENAVTLTPGQMPIHTHTQNPHAHSYTQTGGIPTAAGIEPTLADITTSFPSVTGSTTATNNNAGNDESHNNIQSSLSIAWWIVAR